MQQACQQVESVCISSPSNLIEWPGYNFCFMMLDAKAYITPHWAKQLLDELHCLFLNLFLVPRV
jgi:hypothetical protein